MAPVDMEAMIATIGEIETSLLPPNVALYLVFASLFATFLTYLTGLGRNARPLAQTIYLATAFLSFACLVSLIGAIVHGNQYLIVGTLFANVYTATSLLKSLSQCYLIEQSAETGEKSGIQLV